VYAGINQMSLLRSPFYPITQVQKGLWDPA